MIDQKLKTDEEYKFEEGLHDKRDLELKLYDWDRSSREFYAGKHDSSKPLFFGLAFFVLIILPLLLLLVFNP